MRLRIDSGCASEERINHDDRDVNFEVLTEWVWEAGWVGEHVWLDSWRRLQATLLGCVGRSGGASRSQRKGLRIYSGRRWGYAIWEGTCLRSGLWHLERRLIYYIPHVNNGTNSLCVNALTHCPEKTWREFDSLCCPTSR